MKSGNGVAEAPRPSRLDVPPAKAVVKQVIKVTAPNMMRIRLKITGTAPYLQCRFSKKAMDKMRDKQSLGDNQQSGKKPRRAARDFRADYLGAMHKINRDTYGIPASAFRQAAISACTLVGFHKTQAKKAIFIEADGFDVIDSTPLVKINGAPEPHEMIGRNADGNADIRIRAIWRKWSATLVIKFDADVFSASDIFNLFLRVGIQVGVGEGRPDSKNSAGMGLGTFDASI